MMFHGLLCFPSMIRRATGTWFVDNLTALMSLEPEGAAMMNGIENLDSLPMPVLWAFPSKSVIFPVLAG